LLHLAGIAEGVGAALLELCEVGDRILHIRTHVPPEWGRIATASTEG
jgi:hypothetical protein